MLLSKIRFIFAVQFLKLAELNGVGNSVDCKIKIKNKYFIESKK